MGGYGARVLVALALAAFLFFQARNVGKQPHRRRAFLLAAAALLIFSVYNGALAARVALGPLQAGLAIAGMALFIGAVASLLFSFSSGELRGERERIAAAAREYRERRGKSDER
jgi:predicted benzoate:H+ symporter BenE